MSTFHWSVALLKWHFVHGKSFILVISIWRKTRLTFKGDRFCNIELLHRCTHSTSFLYLISTWWKYLLLYFMVINMCKRGEFLYTVSWWKVWKFMCRMLSRHGCKYKERAMSTVPPNIMVHGTQPGRSINMKVTKALQRAWPLECSGLPPPRQSCSPLMTNWWNAWHMDFPHSSEIFCRSI